MADPYGPPAPPTAQGGYNELRKAIIHTIPASLGNTATALRQMRRKRSRG